MARLHALGLVVGLSLCTIGCTNELTSELKIDGEAFVPTSCRAGQVNGFAGADLIDDSGAPLRLVQPPAGMTV